jgi:hypothetical protein
MDYIFHLYVKSNNNRLQSKAFAILLFGLLWVKTETITFAKPNNAGYVFLKYLKTVRLPIVQFYKFLTYPRIYLRKC